MWVGLRMPNRDEVSKVAEVCGMDDLDVDDAIAPHDRPVLTDAGASWLVLRTGDTTTSWRRCCSASCP